MTFPIWGDEAFVAYSLLVRNFQGMLRPLEYGQFAPLLFMWAELGAFRLLGSSECALRLVPFLCGVVSLLWFWRFCRRTLDPAAGVLAMGIFAVSYYLVRHGAEVKPYAGDLLAAVALLDLGWRVHQQPTWGRWLTLLAVVVVGVWWSYTAVFVAGGVGLLLLVDLLNKPSRGALVGLGVYGLLLVGGFSIMYFFQAKGQRHAAEWITEIPTWKNAFPPREFWRWPLWLLGVHTGNMLAYPAGSKGGGSTATFVLMLIGGVATWRRDRSLVLVLLAPLGLNLVAAVLHAYPYGTSARICLYAAPAVCLLAGVGVWAVLRRWFDSIRAERGFLIAAGVLVAIGAAGMARDIVRPTKTAADAENRRVLRALAANTSPNDRWIIFNNEGDSSRGSFIGAYGGLGARFRFYVHTLSPVLTVWAPDPTKVKPPESQGRVLLLAYEADFGPGRSEELAGYVQQMTIRFGSPQAETYRLDHNERILAYWFRPSRRANGDRHDAGD
jgi:hypothetical protein